ncbi:MAG: hypothetical protein ACOC2F_02785 [Bacteroidota bacterium]
MNFYQPSSNPLLDESRVDRPVTLHKGQIEVNSSYGLTVFGNKYDGSGIKTDLQEKGLATIKHEGGFDIRYGVFEFLELGFQSGYISKTERSREKYYFSYNEYMNVQSLSHEKGFSDVLFSTAVRYPVKTSNFSMAVRGGIMLPVGTKGELAPEHTMSHFPELAYYELKMKTNEKASHGVKQYLFGGIMKIKLNKTAITAGSSLITSNKTGIAEGYIYRNNNLNFEYEKINYDYQLPDVFVSDVMVDYQAFSWFAVFGGYHYYSSSSGWDGKTGIRIAEPTKKLHEVTLGFEIQATSNVRIFETINYSLGGRNTLAPFSIYSGISMVLFP